MESVSLSLQWFSYIWKAKPSTWRKHRNIPLQVVPPVSSSRSKGGQARMDSTADVKWTGVITYFFPDFLSTLSISYQSPGQLESAVIAIILNRQHGSIVVLLFCRRLPLSHERGELMLGANSLFLWCHSHLFSKQPLH